MTTSRIQLPINTKGDNIEIVIPRPLEGFSYLRGGLSLVLHYDGKEIILAADNIGFEILQDFCHLIKAMVQGELELAPSITRNIGYMWHEWELNERFSIAKPILECSENCGIEWWVGMDYLFFCNGSESVEQWMTFVYSKQGKYFLEVVPKYEESAPGASVDSYKAFLSNYSSMVLIEIDPNNLQEWAFKLQSLLDIYVKNSGFTDRYNVDDIDRPADGQA